MDNEYNLLGAIRVLLRWRKQILIATVGATILAAAFSWFFMDDYYKSSATIYPINLAYSDRAAVFNLEHVEYYGNKEDVNRVLVICQSGPIEGYIIDKYNLVDHYKINKNKKYWKTKVQKAFESNYKAIKTEEGAIELSIYDTDPAKAAAIINDIINEIDNIYRSNLTDSKKQQLVSFTKKMADEREAIEKYGDTLSLLGKQYNIVVHAGSGAGSRKADIDIVEGSDLKAVEKYKEIYARQKNTLIEYNVHSNIKGEIEISLQNDNKSIAIIDAPVVADQKEKPVRWLICLTTMLLTFVVSVFAALLVDQVQDIRRQL
jgi:uncharacterized protein involved in exopolysaccharide biosynthesis